MFQTTKKKRLTEWTRQAPNKVPNNIPYNSFLLGRGPHVAQRGTSSLASGHPQSLKTHKYASLNGALEEAAIIIVYLERVPSLPEGSLPELFGVRFLMSGLCRGPGKAIKKVGGEALHISEELPCSPGPARPQKGTPKNVA